MDISPIHSQGQAGGGNGKAASPGLGGLFAQMLLGIAPSEPPAAEPGPDPEPQVNPTSNQNGQGQDQAAEGQATETPAAEDTAPETAPDPVAETATPTPQPQPIAETPQPIALPTDPAATQGQTKEPTAVPAAPTAPDQTQPPAQAAATPQVDPKGKSAKASDSAPQATAPQPDAVEPAVDQTGDRTRPQTAGKPAPTEPAAPAPETRQPSEAASARPLNADTPPSPAPPPAAATQTAEPAEPAATAAKTAAAPEPAVQAAAAQVAGQPQPQASRNATAGDPAGPTSDDPGFEFGFGDKSSERAAAKTSETPAPTMTGAAKPEPQKPAGTGNQQGNPEQAGQQTANRPGSQAEFLETLTAAKQSARGFDLGFLSQVNPGVSVGEAALQSFTLSADGASLVPTQQVSATGSVELSGALPPRGAVVDPGAQLAIQISRAITAQTNRFSIRLDPPELGRIDVKLDFARDGQVRATVAAERPDTLDLLQKDVQSLERALRDAGTDPNKLSLNFSLQGEQHQGQMAEQNQSEAGARDAGDDDEAQADADSDNRHRSRADALVDLHV